MKKVNRILDKYKKDATRLMDILIDIQSEFGYIPVPAIECISEGLKMSMADVEQTISFYHFFSMEPRGKYTVYLNNSLVANMMGREEVARTFEKEVGCNFEHV
jgi:[NiFe] hydrogenase diaphorase moiety large subunit